MRAFSYQENAMTAAELWVDSQSVFEKLPLIFRLGNIRIISPRAQVMIESDLYQVETLSDPRDLKEIFKLRYDVFFREFAGRGDRFSFMPYDMDLHDFSCDHLIVREKNTKKIVATYRLLLQEENEEREFYTETEFNLENFRKLPGNKLELGRACVHKDFRSGLVISLLWKGLCAYAKKTSTKYMFGCSSLSREEFQDLPFIRAQFEKRGVISELEVNVQPEYHLSHYPMLKLPTELSADHQKMPSLLNMYLLAGAKVGSEIAYDEEMDCLDFFTVMDFTNLPSSFERRFA